MFEVARAAHLARSQGGGSVTLLDALLWLPVLGVGLAAPPAAFTADDLPRYRLEVGQQLSYKQASEFKYEGPHGPGVYSVTMDWDVWVTRANKDGSWRIVLHVVRKFSRVVTGKNPYNLSNTAQELEHFDLFPDGRIVGDIRMGSTATPETLFPCLPADLAALKKGWADHVKWSDEHLRYRAADRAKGEDGEWAFEQVRENPLDAIYHTTFNSVFYFDRAKGHLARAESENTQSYSYKGRGTGTTRRVAVRKHEADWVERFAAQSDRYFAASKRYFELLRQAEKSPTECKALLGRAKAVLDDALGDTTLPLLRERLGERIEKHSDLARWTQEDAEGQLAVLGRPAPGWKLKDLDGKEHSLAGYRGKVVVLDFWYRGCGWCVRAMPQVVELAEDFKDQPVVVLGMNTDVNEEDARFVVQMKKLPYPNLKARGVPQHYKVHAYPTLILIDPKGNVAEFHVGYSPTLRKDVGASIRRLLGEK
jgi:thiol-disulfide isomerase/thioredoxin